MASVKKTSIVNVSEKRATLYVVMMGIWLLILATSAPSLWRTFSGLESILAKALFVPFVVCLALFWFYGVYHWVFLVFSYMRKPDLMARGQAVAQGSPASPKVAIIYTTYNDFNREAALSCLNQDYPNYHVFLLDVSTNPDMRKQVDAFHDEFASSTTLFQRKEQWNQLVARAMNNDVSWEHVCQRYEELYQRAMELRHQS